MAESSSSDEDRSSSDSSGSRSNDNEKKADAAVRFNNHSSDGSTSSSSSSSSDDNEEETIRINPKYARDYEVRKRAEELTKHRRSGEVEITNNSNSDSDDSSDESEDENAELLTPKLDVQIIQTLRAIRAKEQSVYDKKVSFFDNNNVDDYDDEDDDESEESDSNERKKKNKPKRYRDVIREQILEQMKYDDDDDDANNNNNHNEEMNNDGEMVHGSNRNDNDLAYDAEQREIRRAFLKSHDDNRDDGNNNNNNNNDDDDDDDDEDWIKPKTKTKTSMNDNNDNDDDEMAKKLWEEELRLQTNTNVNVNGNDDDDMSSYKNEMDIDQEIKKSKKGKKKKKKNNDSSIDPYQHSNSSSMCKTVLVDPKGEIEDGDKFLLEFMTHRKWLEGRINNSSSSRKDQNNNNSDDDNDDDSLDDLYRTDEFESKYNFRFEESTNTTNTTTSNSVGQSHGIVHYARSSNATNNVLRRKDDTRKLKRSERHERKAAERTAKEVKLKRLRNAKRDELEGRLERVRKVLGYTSTAITHGGAQDVATDDDNNYEHPFINDKNSSNVVGGYHHGLDPNTEAMILQLMEGEYDPDNFERVMNTAYGDEYYNTQDVGWKSDADVKRDLLADAATGVDEDVDDVVGVIKDGEMYDDDEDEQTADDEGDVDDDNEYYEDEDPYYNDTSTSTKLDDKLRTKMSNELYKLDYEDIIGDMPTRFKYRSVRPNNYGLSTEEVLLANDTTLKQFVSLRKMAPYIDANEEEYQPGTKKRKRFRQIVKVERQQALEEAAAMAKEVDAAASTKMMDEVLIDGKTTTKKKKRRRQKKGSTSSTREKVGQDEEVGVIVAVSAQEEEGTAQKSNEAAEKKSRRRKKKKGQRVNTFINTDDDAGDDDDNNACDAKVVTQIEVHEATNVADGLTSVKKDRGAGDSMKKSKKKKNKSLGIDGVSGARLAAYGL